MKRFSLFVGIFALALVLPKAEVQAQYHIDGYNPHSVNPIHSNDIMYAKRVWRRMDLEEKQNLPFFAFNNEITKLIIDAVKAGQLPVYRNDSLTTRKTKEEFLKDLMVPDYGGERLSEEEKAMGFTEDDGWGDDGGGWGDDGGAGWGESEDGGDGGDASADSGSDDYFFPSQVSVLEIMEDMIFDRRRSRLFWDIQSVKMVIPAKYFETGLQRDLGVFKYQDLEKLFRSMPEKAIWFNPQNSAEHRNLADAFLLRLFNARIVKVANPRDDYLADIYNQSPKAGIIASVKTEQDLMEMEHNLWEF